MTIAGKHIIYTASDGGERFLYRMTADGQDLTKIGKSPISRGLEYCSGVLYGAVAWPGRLYRIDTEGELLNTSRLKTNWPSDLAFDGEKLWYLEVSGIDNRYGVHALDIESGGAKAYFGSSDIKISGLAYGNGRLWISSGTGYVYEVDPARAIRSGRLEDGVLRKFKGQYSRLSFSEGYLWGVDNEARRLCKIKLDIND